MSSRITALNRINIYFPVWRYALHVEAKSVVCLERDDCLSPLRQFKGIWRTKTRDNLYCRTTHHKYRRCWGELYLMMIRSLNQSRLRLVCVCGSGVMTNAVGSCSRSHVQHRWDTQPESKNRLRGLRTRMNLVEEG